MASFFSFRKWVEDLLGPLTTTRRKAFPARKRIRPLLEELENRLPPAASFSIATANIIEPGPAGTANMDFTVTRIGDISSLISVGYTTVAGSAQPNVDFTPQTGTATFAPGSSTALIKIPVFGTNAYNHFNLSFSVQLNGVVTYGTTFTAKTDITAGSSPIGVVLGDINKDGKLDLVVVNSATNSVAVLLNTTALGNNTPTFAAPQSFGTGPNPFAVVIADINLDGNPDLVVADNTNPGSISVLLNSTSPGATTLSFVPYFDFTTGSNPVSLAAADLNNDGKPDLAVANNGSNSLSVLLNTTSPGAITPTFANHIDFTTGTAPNFVAIGDLNGDGLPELVVTNGGSNSVSLFGNTTSPGAATASFAGKQDFTTGAHPDSVALADINGDGKIDLAVANATDNTVSLLLNTTSPGASTFSFAGKQDFATGTNPRGISVKDLNGDGQPDLVVANNGVNANSVSVLLNATKLGASAPLLAPQQTFVTGAGPSALALGDINGDGEPDLLITDSASGANAVSVLLNSTPLPNATVASSFPATQINMNGPTISAVIGDINGDGKPDLIIGPVFGSYAVSVLLNMTPPGAVSPTFASPVGFNAPMDPFFVALGDINNDGKPDIIVIANKDNQNNSVGVFLNTTPTGGTTPSFAAIQTFKAGTVERRLVVADFNGDGLLDLAVANYSGNIGVLTNTTTPGNTTFTFAAPVFFPTGPGPSGLALGDFNGDGKPDLVTSNFNGSSVSVLLNTTTPGSATPTFANQTSFIAGNDPESVAVGDLNGDGRPDIVVANEQSSATVLLNKTAPGATVPSFGAAVGITTGDGYIAVNVQDINGDGKPDVFLNNYFSGGQYALMNTTGPGSSTPTFTTQKILVLGRATNSLALGAFNGNGRPDVVVTAQGTSNVTIFMNIPSSVASGFATAVIHETVQFAVASETLPENSGAFSVNVSLALASPVDTSIPFSVSGSAAGGVNFTALTASPLIIPAGQTSATITGTLIDDNKFDTSNKTLTLILGTPSNATLGSITANTLIIKESDPKTTLGASVGASTVSTLIYGTPVTLTATLAPTIGNIPPTAGAVDFLDGAIDLGAIATETVSGSNAIFTLVTTPTQLPVIQANSGSHTITAVYSTGSGFNGSTGILAGGLKVTTASLTITAVTNTKTYDSTTTAAARATVTGLQGNDTVTGLAEVYSDRNAGTSKTISVSAYTINDGNGGNNYTLTTVSNTTGVINKASITITAPAYTKTYDSTTTATAFSVNPSTLPANDTATATEVYSDTKAGSGKTLSISAYTINDGNAGNNYTVTTLTNTTGVIIKAPLTITATTNTKNYDQTTTAAATPTVSGLLGSNTVTGLAEVYGDANVGSGKTLSISAYRVNDGNNSNNYFVTTIDNTTAVINAVPISNFVAGLIPGPNGFTANFSQPLNPTALTLYGPNLTTPQDVTLRGSNGRPIHGSLIFDPTNMSFTFIATASYLLELNSLRGIVSAVLPDDTYTITFLSGSGSNGFLIALEGGSFGSGITNYTTTFTTSYQHDATPVLGIPDFARGPDSNMPIQVPNIFASGIPITLYNAAAVTDVTFSLTYNPLLLNVGGGGISDATDPNHANLILVSNFSGVATFHYTDPNPISATPTMPLVLGDITAFVPSGNGAPALSLYQVKELLQLNSIVINKGAITNAVAANGIHVNAYLGDVNGDKVVTGLDMLAADNVAQGHGTGFSAFLQLDPVIIGDVAGDYSIDAGDVGTINSFVAQLQPLQVPVPPTQLLISNPNYVNPNSIHAPNAADPTVSLVTRGLTALGSPSISVLIDHPHPEGSAGLTSATLALTYDPAALSITPEEITLGTIPGQGQGWQLAAVVDKATGQIGIQVYSLTPITATQAGSLVNLTFHTVPGARLGISPPVLATTTIQLVDMVTPNGQWFGTGVTDSQGALILSPGVDQVQVVTNVGYQNSPGEFAWDQLFVALAGGADVLADLGLANPSLDNLIWDAPPGLDDLSFWIT